MRKKILNLSEASWNLRDPLPPIRALAARFGLSLSAVYRLLQNLAHEGKLVAHEINGRFYLKEGESFAVTNFPVVCLFRNMENWFFAARKTLIGISQECERIHRGMLLFRHDHLVKHSSVDFPPQFGGVHEQITSLERFFKTQRGNYSVILLEDLWQDEALKRFESELSRAIVIGRETTLPFLKSIQIDHKAAAYKILAHLHGRGYERIVMAIPFKGNPEITQRMIEIERASKVLGISIFEESHQLATCPEERRTMIQMLKQSAVRTAIYCPEDNVTRLIFEEMRDQGVDCPQKIGLMSGMGEDSILDLDITSIQVNYQEIGSRAVTKVFEKSTSQHETMEPSFYQGKTT